MTVKAVQARLSRKDIRLSASEIKEILNILELDLNVPTEFNEIYTNKIIAYLDKMNSIQQVEDVQEVATVEENTLTVIPVSEQVTKLSTPVEPIEEEIFQTVDILDEYLEANEITTLHSGYTVDNSVKNILLQGLPKTYKDFYEGYHSIEKVVKLSTEMLVISQSFSEISQQNEQTKEKYLKAKSYLKNTVIACGILLFFNLFQIFMSLKINTNNQTFGGTYRINVNEQSK